MLVGERRDLARTGHMAASDDLIALAQRAKVAEDRVAALKTQERSDVEQQVAKGARRCSRRQISCRRRPPGAQAGASEWWSDVQRTWSGHIARLRSDMGSKKAGMDAKKARLRARAAEDDAALAVAFAFAARRWQAAGHPRAGPGR